MDYVTLGRTEIKVCKNGFGALPIQRISFDSAKSVMHCRTFVTKYTLPQKPPHKMPMIFGKT